MSNVDTGSSSNRIFTFISGFSCSASLTARFSYSGFSAFGFYYSLLAGWCCYCFFAPAYYSVGTSEYLEPNG